MPEAKEVQEKRARFGQQNIKQESGTSAGGEKDNMPLFGCKNYKPEIPHTADEESTKRHISHMKEAYKARKEIETSKIDNLMGLTLYARRDEILNGGTVKEVLEKYPWLTRSSNLF